MHQPIIPEDLIGNDLQSIWRDPRFVSFCQFPFMAPNYLQAGSVLFVGINPSYNEADLGIQYYGYANSPLHYFRKFGELAQQANQPWSHMDMLFFRETKQNKVHSILRQPYGVEFIWQQLQLAKRLLEAAQPSVIVVCNALARKLLGADANRGKDVWLGFNFTWDESIGTYRLGYTPVLFSSMLTGQRALDSGSYERLAWQLRLVLANVDQSVEGGPTKQSVH